VVTTLLLELCDRYPVFLIFFPSLFKNGKCVVEKESWRGGNNSEKTSDSVTTLVDSVI
jgi:hypothetical protein